MWSVLPLQRLAVEKVAGGDWVFLCTGVNPMSETCHQARSTSSSEIEKGGVRDSDELSHAPKQFNKNSNIYLVKILKDHPFFISFILLFDHLY